MKYLVSRYRKNRIVVIDGHEKILFVVRHYRNDWRKSPYPELLTVFEAKQAVISFNRWTRNTGEYGFRYATAHIVKVRL